MELIERTIGAQIARILWLLAYNHGIDFHTWLQAYALENGLTYWETSAKSNTNVNDMFEDIAKRLPRVSFNLL